MKQTQAILDAILAKMIAATGPYDPAALFLGVFTAITDHGVDTVMADVTEATGAMATRVAVTPWGSIYHMNDNRAVVDGPPAAFSPANDTEAQTIAGWFLASAGVAGTLKAWGTFPTPFPMVNEFSQVTIIPRITVDPDGRWSAEIVFNG